MAKIAKLSDNVKQQNYQSEKEEVRRERKSTKNQTSLRGNPIVAIWDTVIVHHRHRRQRSKKKLPLLGKFCITVVQSEKGKAEKAVPPYP